MWIDFVGLTHSPTILRAIFRKRAETSFLFRMLPWICRKKTRPIPFHWRNPHVLKVTLW
jgi:hypothetical protein